MTPRKLRIREDTARELLTYSDETFDMSCVWDLGVGVFERDAFEHAQPVQCGRVHLTSLRPQDNRPR